MARLVDWNNILFLLLVLYSYVNKTGRQMTMTKVTINEWDWVGAASSSSNLNRGVCSHWMSYWLYLALTHNCCARRRPHHHFQRYRDRTMVELEDFCLPPNVSQPQLSSRDCDNCSWAFNLILTSLSSCSWLDKRYRRNAGKRTEIIKVTKPQETRLKAYGF